MKRLIPAAILAAGLLCGCVRSEVPESSQTALSFSVDEVEQLSVQDIMDMNEGSEVRFSPPDGETYFLINGKFSKDRVKNADDALRAAAGVAEIMDIKEQLPQLRLAEESSQSSKKGYNYVFRQYIGDARVVGASLVVRCGSESGIPGYIYSTLKKLPEIDPEIKFTAEQAAELVRDRYGEPAEPELVIYSQERLAWCIEVKSMKTDVYIAYIDAKDPGGRVLGTEQEIID
ncbi:MAG: hypothetical protein IJ071_13285 [Ruminococcus sp.]|nr:hypothetical protein [Ruminococcus sp.]